MKVIRPSTFSPVDLVSSNALVLLAEYSAGVTYNTGDTVTYGDEGSFESLIDSNTGNTPTTALTSWLRVGPTNELAMFDNQISSKTYGDTTLTVEVHTGSINSIGILNILGSTVTLTIRDGSGGSIIYGPIQLSLDGDTPLDWYDYFYFEQEDQRTQALFLDLPVGYANAHATLELEGTGSIYIGEFIYGTLTKLGNTEYGLSSGITDYSTKETDEFGETTFVRREFSKRISADIQVDNTQLNKLQRILFSLRSTPALWIGADDARYEEATVVFGFYRDFSTNISYPTVSRCSLEIEGLI